MATPADEQKPTRNLREFYQAQPPMGDAIRAGVERIFPHTVAQGRDVEANVSKAYNNGGLISAAGEAMKRVSQPAIGVAQDVGTSLGRVGGLLNPFAKKANAQPAPTPAAPATAKQPTVQKPSTPQSGSTLGLTPASLDKMWNTPLNQTKPAAPAGNARSRPTVPGAPKQQATTAPIQAAAAPAQAQDDSVIIDRGIGRPGSTMAMIDHETGQILTAGGGTDTYRPFEGQYVTQDQQDLITGNRLKIGDPMTAGQAGAISKQAALLTGDAARNAAAIEQQKMQVEGGIAQQRISSGASIEGQRIAHGESNKLKALEVKAVAALDAALKSGDGAAIAAAQQQLAAIRGGTGTEFAPLNIYDDMGNVIGQRLYNKKNGVVQGMGGEQGVTQADISATAKKHGISEEEVVNRLKAEGKL